MARSAAGWGDEHSDPGTLGVRTNEHLRYSAGGMVGKHTDDESVYTIVVALSDPADYDGGEYVLYDDQVPDPPREHRVKLRRLSALVFLSSLTLHGVSPITRGSREVFAAELWEEDDVPTDWMRPNVRDFREGVLGQAVEL
jgi:predicted 2-oxoglutarate/Fe(II)-dependent dioxygenase YbiX